MRFPFRSFETRAVDTFDVTAGASLAAAILGNAGPTDDSSSTSGNSGSGNSGSLSPRSPSTSVEAAAPAESVSYQSLANAIKKFPAVLATGKAAAKLRSMVREEEM
jgi:hypothetical protein